MKKHTAAADLPTTEQIARERSRLRYKRRYGRTLRSTAAILLVVAALAVLVATLWMPVLRIKTETFTPGDITAFYYGNKLLIKRYIAGPADWVDIDADGIVSINGNVLDEPYLTAHSYGETTITLPYQVPDERYFLMGDNRDVSIDSRSTAVGCVAADQVVGKVVFRIWPLSDFGPVR